ncbi:MAG: RNA polymerase sigma factor [Coprobacillaceae bacterium]
MLNKITDDIVESFKNGEEEAFNKIYKHYYKRLYFYALQYCQDTILIEDIVQNAFVSAYRSRKKLRSNAAFHTWLFRIAHNEILSITKKEKLKNTNISSSMNVEDIINKDEVQVDEKIRNDEVFKKVDNSIKSMKPRHKNVAVLHYYYEFSNEEIANILAIPEGTVKSRLSRINKKLQTSLVREGYAIGIERAGVTISLVIPTILERLNITIPVEKIQDLGMNEVVGGTTTILTLKRIITSLLIGGGAVGGFYMWTFQGKSVAGEPLVPQMDHIVMEDPCKIKDIIYSDAYTSLSIPINVETTNTNYDKILINGQEIESINENGQYVIEVLKDNVVIDSRVLEISNIDRTAPRIISTDSEENVYRITIGDDLSGINISSIRYSLNGISSNAYEYVSSDSMLIFTYQEGTTNVFYIEDNAGNWDEITIE